MHRRMLVVAHTLTAIRFESSVGQCLCSKESPCMSAWNFHSTVRALAMSSCNGAVAFETAGTLERSLQSEKAGTSVLSLPLHSKQTDCSKTVVRAERNKTNKVRKVQRRKVAEWDSQRNPCLCTGVLEYHWLQQIKDDGFLYSNA